MSSPNLNELLRGTDLFAGLPKRELARLAAIAEVCHHPAGSLLFREGDPSSYLAVVLSGEVEIVKSLESPAEQLLGVIGQGELLGEMSLVYRQPTRSASARARQPVACVQFPLTEFEELLGRQPALAVALMKLVVGRTRSSEMASVAALTEKNRRLEQALHELRASQAQLLAQEKIQTELRMARRIQESLLPENMPVLPGYRLGAVWQPARAVSGDFYDFIALDETQLGIVIGDVTDKGVPASLVMTATRSLLRASAAAEARLARRGLVSPGAILAQANELLYADIPLHMFVTCLFAVLQPTSGRLRLANAGHCLPLLNGPQGLSELRARGMPLGLMPGQIYEELEIELPSACSLTLYSDGLPEAHNPAGEMFGFARLRAWAEAQPPGTAAEIQGLLDQVAGFTGPELEQEDDMTVVALAKFDPQGEA